MTTNRIIGIDIVKTFAIIFVIAGHFFTINTPFLSAPFSGVSMFLQGIGFELFLAGVPLFIMATGYLNAHKTISKYYFLKIFNVLLSYLFFSILVLIFRHLYFGDSISLIDGIKGILNFTAIPYAWYIEMWIGLYLLTPFLNILYSHLKTKRHKQALLIVLYLLTVLPFCTNRYGLHLLPDFWVSIWPLLFFFLGTYLKEYVFTVKRWILIVIILLICLIEPSFNLIFFPKHDFIQPIGDKLLMPFLAGAIFVLCQRITTQKPIIVNSFTKISKLSLDIYLCCCIFDWIFYPIFNKYYQTQSQFGIYFFLIVPLVFLSSMILSQLKQWLWKICKIDKIFV